MLSRQELSAFGTSRGELTLTPAEWKPIPFGTSPSSEQIRCLTSTAFHISQPTSHLKGLFLILRENTLKERILSAGYTDVWSPATSERTLNYCQTMDGEVSTARATSLWHC